MKRERRISFERHSDNPDRLVVLSREAHRYELDVPPLQRRAQRRLEPIPTVIGWSAHRRRDERAERHSCERSDRQRTRVDLGQLECSHPSDRERAEQHGATPTHRRHRSRVDPPRGHRDPSRFVERGVSEKQNPMQRRVFARFNATRSRSLPPARRRCRSSCWERSSRSPARSRRSQTDAWVSTRAYQR